MRRFQQTVWASVGTPAGSSLRPERREHLFWAANFSCLHVLCVSWGHPNPVVTQIVCSQPYRQTALYGRANLKVCNQLLSLLQPPTLCVCVCVCVWQVRSGGCFILSIFFCFVLMRNRDRTTHTVHHPITTSTTRVNDSTLICSITLSFKLWNTICTLRVILSSRPTTRITFTCVFAICFLFLLLSCPRDLQSAWRRRQQAL